MEFLKLAISGAGVIDVYYDSYDSKVIINCNNF